MSVTVTEKFKIDSRYNHITVSYYYWPDLGKMEKWCRDKSNGEFTIDSTGIIYKTDEDLSKFLLRWS